MLRQKNYNKKALTFHNFPYDIIFKLSKHPTFQMLDLPDVGLS